MLVLDEKDRIPWEYVFEDPVIRIEEHKIRANLDEILKQKGSFHFYHSLR
jgi:hypothetical protein